MIMRSQIRVLTAFLAVIFAKSFGQDRVPLRCTRPLRPGNCRAEIDQYYFDTESQQCKSFTYTGCHGNENRFRTLELCERTCLRSVSDYESPPNSPPNNPPNNPPTNPPNSAPSNLPRRCTLTRATGLCRAAFTRYYFDTVSGSCRTFIYGGCGGNRNNFQTQEECENACLNN